LRREKRGPKQEKFKEIERRIRASSKKSSRRKK
jgi:hypothetical protein